MMSKNSTTISNLLPDLEKGVTEVEKGEEEAIVDSQKAKLISRVWVRLTTFSPFSLFLQDA
jgi:hypothetical protein